MQQVLAVRMHDNSFSIYMTEMSYGGQLDPQCNMLLSIHNLVAVKLGWFRAQKPGDRGPDGYASKI